MQPFTVLSELFRAGWPPFEWQSAMQTNMQHISA